jgi:hypothetical protein
MTGRRFPHPGDHRAAVMESILLIHAIVLPDAAHPKLSAAIGVVGGRREWRMCAKRHPCLNELIIDC